MKRRLYERAVIDGDVGACQWWLKNRKPREWADKREIATTKPLEVIQRVIVTPDRPEVIEGGEVEVIEHSEGEEGETAQSATHVLPKQAEV